MEKYFFIDVLKTLGAQIIVLHHLSSYGPLSHNEGFIFIQHIQEWFASYGRYAVQIFLVLGGYFAMHNLLSQPTKTPLFKVIFRRYCRLLPPYAVALLFTILCVTLGRKHVSFDFFGQHISFSQAIAHFFLLQDHLGFEPILTGAWYLSIDLQLFAFVAILQKTFQNLFLFIAITGSIMFGSFVYFSSQSNLDTWPIYFLGSYGLGILVYFTQMKEMGNLQKISLYIYIFIGMEIFFLTFHNFSLKNLCAYIISLCLFFSMKLNFSWGRRFPSIMHWMSQRSYSLFLIHYPIIVIFNILFLLIFDKSPIASLFLFLSTWLLSILMASFLYLYVEEASLKLIHKKFF